MNQTVKYIGIVQSELKTIEDCPLQENEDAPEAVITIFPEFIEGMKDLSAGSEIILLTWLHKADRDILTCHPRNDLSSPLTGIFSTRSPDRPNPVGLHLVKIVSIDFSGVLKVSGLEVLDGTPLLDIKPALSKLDY